MSAGRAQGNPRRGDVFEMPTPDGRFGYGVVVEGGGCPYVAILHGLYDSRPALAELEGDEVALVGWTMDSWFFHGRWLAVGKLNPDQFDVPYPNHIVRVDDELHATDYKGDILGPIEPNEHGLLQYKSSRSPVGFQNAFLALHGYREWDSADEKLTADYARQRVTRTPASVARH